MRSRVLTHVEEGGGGVCWFVSCLKGSNFHMSYLSWRALCVTRGPEGSLLACRTDRFAERCLSVSSCWIPDVRGPGLATLRGGCMLQVLLPGRKQRGGSQGSFSLAASALSAFGSVELSKSCCTKWKGLWSIGVFVFSGLKKKKVRGFVVFVCEWSILNGNLGNHLNVQHLVRSVLGSCWERAFAPPCLTRGWGVPACVQQALLWHCCCFSSVLAFRVIF